MGQNTERGATLVEMAVVLPILLFVTISIFELGLAFKDHLTVTQGVRDGTRMLSAKGDDADADCATIEQVLDTALVTLSLDQIERVEIFKANTDGSQDTTKTNKYNYIGGDPRDCANWYTPGVQWPPGDRQVRAGSTPLDIVGVRLIYNSAWATNFPPYSGSFTIDRSSISRIEPEVFE